MKTNKNDMISRLFHQRNQFVVIGLTGRTGSGCTTAAQVLEKPQPSFPGLPEVTQNGKPFFIGLDAKRYEILSRYATENYAQFFNIKISDLISGYILSLPEDQVVEFVSHQTRSENRDPIRKLIEAGVFKSTKANKGVFSLISERILNHESKFVLEPAEEAKFISFMKLIKRFTNEFKKELMSVDNEST